MYELLNTNELEEILDTMFSIALVAEHKGFLLGAKLIAECLS